MQFTNAEVRFLSDGHTVRNRGWVKIDAGMLRSCPKRIMLRILETRARELGQEFEDFREEQRRLANPNEEYRFGGGLDAQIAGNGLF